MQNIVYKSESIIPWDTQSAFKMTSYKAEMEEHMVFCYLKGYVHQGDLVLCSYCFTEKPTGNNSIHIYANLSPENREKVLQLDFGYDGISNLSLAGESIMDKHSVSFHPFKSDDEQGFYWCGEIVIDKDTIQKLYSTQLSEGSIFTLNMTQTFENGDLSTLFGNAQDEEYNPTENMNVFLVLNY